MACRGFLEFLLKLFNFLLSISGLAIVGYGIYLLIEWNRFSPGSGDDPISPVSDGAEIWKLGRPMLLVTTLSGSFADKLPTAWFIYVFIGIGAILFVISFFGCIGAVSRNGCCLSCYAFLVILLILLELGAAAFIFFDHDWKDLIPKDTTGRFDMIYGFLKENWKIVKWVALGAVIFEALVFLLAILVRAANRPADYDSDDEYIAAMSNLRQPLINRQGQPATGVPLTATLDQRPSRNDAWSQRMREKYGLDTSEFTYNPSDANRFQQGAAPQAEERSRCNIL
ncbi:tobamovirus multiplication protein 2A [Phalaenopsis equestris]|uniref:tobamovirus multiplication protein 2A n=1 Tax=Phalaenopsis equestris TaxID=78828 RepID=UPI0009E1E9AC|nr:tobamovirus multiplication protein 2A [Phalaenopsis equestris]